MADTKYVLLAEDDDDIRSMIAETLRSESEGFQIEVIEAKDGYEAAQHAERREFDCVITDLKMPRATGEDLIRALLNNPINANTPTLVVSGHIDDSFTAQFQNVRTFRKPFKPHELARAAVREIKLGRKNERVSVHLMNPFVESLMGFLKAELNYKPATSGPVVKKSGENVEGDCHCTMSLAVGAHQARFTIGFDFELLKHLKQSYFASRTQNWVTLTPESTARQISMIAFERALPNLIPLIGGEPRLTGMTVATANTESFTEIVHAAGIHMTIAVEHGRIIAGAYSKSKKVGK